MATEENWRHIKPAILACLNRCRWAGRSLPGRLSGNHASLVGVEVRSVLDSQFKTQEDVYYVVFMPCLTWWLTGWASQSLQRAVRAGLADCLSLAGSPLPPNTTTPCNPYSSVRVTARSIFVAFKVLQRHVEHRVLDVYTKTHGSRTWCVYARDYITVLYLFFRNR